MKQVVPAATLILLLGTAAYADSVHFKSGPAFLDGGTSLTATGTLAGLGSSNTGSNNVSLIATANATATCTNPSGQNKPPGHNPAPVTVSGGSTIDPGSITHNGSANFTVTAGLTQAQTTIDPSSADFSCPGSSWTEVITDLAFKTAKIFLNDALIATCAFTAEFNGGTDNGQVAKNEVSCTF